MLLKIFSTLFNYNYQVVRLQTTVSKQKIVTLGTLVMIPVSLWFVSGFYLASNLYEVPLWKACIIGSLMAIAILIIDRAFIVLAKDNGGSEIRNFRLFIAIISTILGSLALDLIVFSGDLEEYRAKKLTELREEKKKQFFDENSTELKRYFMEREQARMSLEDADSDLVSEIDGSKGTKKYGEGPAAKEKRRRLKTAELNFAKMDSVYLSEFHRLETEADSVATTSIVKENGAVLSKIKDLHYFAFSDMFSGFYYLVICAFFFCLEFFPFKYKSKTAESLFEKMLYAEEKIGESRLQTQMAQREEILLQDGLFGPRAERLRQLAGNHSNIRKIG
ncbi:hypothetical protein C943_04151 [Mariniradius saccharolyticus AK6]|uniref:DUF4407 domain-containing protein n=1 Tax=Mariniradius saccharolyticus AK6 TaxID=1239962 RepID=M7XZC3_9BACT|nr:DUF4407 domain-containing protein [Mariniradius saccharolyticus]EMS33832.1 hypothetical protein C943_04151 [Mariniradius saccharolyticus AK6]